MNKNDILRIIKNEGLRIPELNKNPNDLINVFGYYYDNGWIVYETDERATVFRSSKFDTEEKPRSEYSVTLEADSEVTNGTIVTVFDVLRKNGFSAVNLRTSKK